MASSSSVVEALAVATSMAPKAQPGTSTFGLFGWVILSVLRVVPSVLLYTITFVTITIPSWIYTLLSISLTVTVNFSTLAVIALACVSTISYLVRYRFHTYARLPAEPPRKEPEVEVFPDSQSRETKPGLSNYLDEFLSAIKVFGYLDRHVFHELTRTMHTRKLIAGETLSLDEEKGFCLVVDGHVQVFVHSKRDESDDGDEDSEEDEVSHEDRHQRYQLLSEVKNGAPLSSLFSILSLFTDDVRLEHTRRASTVPFGAQTSDILRSMNGTSKPTPTSTDDSAVLDSPIRFSQTSSRKAPRHRAASSMGSPAALGLFHQVPPLSLDTHGQDTRHTPIDERDSRRGSNQPSAHPDIVARAAVDSTIAIIPATAFKRLTRMYPKATAHIIQVILSRFYRVTLATGHNYLGLTHEILKTERLISKLAQCELPDFLQGAPLERLKDKFEKEKERTKPEDRLKGIALHNPSAGRRRRSSSTIRSQATLQARIAENRSNRIQSPDGIRSPDPIISPAASRIGVSAGDLLASGVRDQSTFSQPLQTPAATRRGVQSPLDKSYFSPRPMQIQRQDSVDEDDLFREAILENMCNAIGLNKDDVMAPPPQSTEQSPRLVSFDSRKNKAFFNNSFGMMDPVEKSLDGDSESLASVSISAFGASTSQNVLEDMVNEIEIVSFQKGSVLVEQEERLPGLYYVIDGFLEISISTEDDGAQTNILGTTATSVSYESITGASASNLDPSNIKPRTSSSNRSRSAVGANLKRHRQSLSLIKPGAIAGYMPAVSSYRSFTDIIAKSDVVVGFLPRASLERLVERFPIVLLTLAKRLTSELNRTILHIDFALEYIQVDAGQVIYDQDEQSDSIFIILNGRLRAIQEKEDKSLTILGEYGQGDSVGELEVLTGTKRPGSLHAIRDTELAKIPKMLFNSLAQEHPSITMKMSRILAKRMRALMETPQHTKFNERANAVTGTPSSTTNLRTVCILPVSAGVPVVEFASRLTNALTQIGTSIVSLNQGAILNHLGRHAFSKMGKLKLSQYLADLEEKYGLVLYVADTNVQSPWTATCITQSDCILLVGVADGSPAIGEYERFLLTTKTTARRELVLIHAERLCPPGLTRRWLRERIWINGGHHHVQMTYKAAPEPINQRRGRFGTALKQRVQVIQAEIQKYTSRKVRQTPLYSAETPFKGDFHRLARRLCGKSVGLVLGGGGARGIAHVGVIRALEEAGIPIDMVGGTSIGAFIGALYAWDAGIVPMYGRTKRFSGRMGSMWRFALDLTYPS